MDADVRFPRTVVQTSAICATCGSAATFDGVGGEWCSVCRTAATLETRELLYRMVELDLTTTHDSTNGRTLQ
jgi:hypothetical protein